MSDIYEQLEAWEAECDCLKNKIKQLEAENVDYKEAHEDHKRLVREVDVIMNGDNAAEQASLCDLVSQIKAVFAENARLREAMDESYGLLCCIKTSPYRQIGAREVYIPHIDIDRVNHAIDSIKQAVERMNHEQK